MEPSSPPDLPDEPPPSSLADQCARAATTGDPAIRRLWADMAKLWQTIDLKRRLERGEDGFDAY